MAKVIKLKDGRSVKLHINSMTGEVLGESWYNKEGELHRDHGLPAIVATDGYESYYKRNSLYKL